MSQLPSSSTRLPSVHNPLPAILYKSGKPVIVDNYAGSISSFFDNLHPDHHKHLTDNINKRNISRDHDGRHQYSWAIHTIYDPSSTKPAIKKAFIMLKHVADKDEYRNPYANFMLAHIYLRNKLDDFVDLGLYYFSRAFEYGLLQFISDNNLKIVKTILDYTANHHLHELCNAKKICDTNSIDMIVMGLMYWGQTAESIIYNQQNMLILIDRLMSLDFTKLQCMYVFNILVHFSGADININALEVDYLCRMILKEHNQQLMISLNRDENIRIEEHIQRICRQNEFAMYIFRMQHNIPQPHPPTRTLIIFHNRYMFQKKSDKCPICLEDNVICIPTECCHYICVSCYTRLLKSKHSVECPCCRTGIYS